MRQSIMKKNYLFSVCEMRWKKLMKLMVEAYFGNFVEDDVMANTVENFCNI